MRLTLARLEWKNMVEHWRLGALHPLSINSLFAFCMSSCISIYFGIAAGLNLLLLFSSSSCGKNCCHLYFTLHCPMLRSHFRNHLFLSYSVITLTFMLIEWNLTCYYDEFFYVKTSLSFRKSTPYYDEFVPLSLSNNMVLTSDLNWHVIGPYSYIF